MCSAGWSIKADATASTDLQCAECNDGEFTASAGLRKCATWSTCPVGEGMSTPGSKVADRQCTPCNVGSTFSKVNSAAECESVSAACVAGTRTTADATAGADRTCEVCGSGTFTSSPGLYACAAWKKCPVGEGMSAPGSKIADRKCTPCNAGSTFSDIEKIGRAHV